MHRCRWATDVFDEYTRYHDTEWGVPVHDDRKLFEFLVLEGAQAGLSWSTILKKRANYRRAFDKFDMRKVARYDEKKIRSLLADAGIVRNKLKIRAAVANAKVALRIVEEFGSLDAYFWRFTGGMPVQNRVRSMKDVPARTALSDKLSEDLKSRGMTFVGSTIMYAFMQAVGMVNDHEVACFRYASCSRA